jgi:hypothetical protein
VTVSLYRQYVDSEPERGGVVPAGVGSGWGLFTVRIELVRMKRF